MWSVAGDLKCGVLRGISSVECYRDHKCGVLQGIPSVDCYGGPQVWNVAGDLKGRVLRGCQSKHNKIVTNANMLASNKSG